jgi:hypothetical protein
MDDAFGYWLAGFIDGEGCFCITYRGPNATNKVCMLSVALRADDRPLLEEIQRQTGLGKIYDSPGRKTTKPYSRWCVQTQPEVMSLVEVFERYPLRSKKARDFEYWKQAVEVWCSGGRGRNADPTRWARIDQLLTDMRRTRLFEVVA